MPVDEKPIVWVGSSLKDLSDLPRRVRRRFGAALNDVQHGEMPLSAKPLQGFGGASVLEIVESYDSDAYRAVYTVRYTEAVYVLHVFQKKSRQGIQTPQRDLDLIRIRLQQAAVMHADYQREEG